MIWMLTVRNTALLEPTFSFARNNRAASALPLQPSSGGMVVRCGAARRRELSMCGDDDEARGSWRQTGVKGQVLGVGTVETEKR